MNELGSWRRRAERAGWTIKVIGSGHLKWTPPDGGVPVISQKTPSCYRGVKNLRAALRRRGLLV